MIKVKGLCKVFRDCSVLEDVNMEIEKNGIYYFYGLNGAGKTTFFKCLTELETYSGEIKKSMRSMYFVLAENPLYSNLTGLQNILLFTSIYDKEEIYRVTEQYLEPSILKKRKVIKYSLGQKKLLTLIILELLSPEFMILDEFKNGLDIENIYKFRKFLESHRDKSVIFLSGHDEFYLSKADDFYEVAGRKVTKVKKEYILDDIKKWEEKE